MSESKIENRHIILASSVIFLGVFYFIKSRSQNRNLVFNSTEKNHTSGINQISDWLSRNFSFKFGESNDGRQQLYQNHPDGPNIGFQSNDSWLKNRSDVPAKIDLMHQGHSTGGMHVINIIIINIIVNYLEQF